MRLALLAAFGEVITGCIAVYRSVRVSEAKRIVADGDSASA